MLNGVAIDSHGGVYPGHIVGRKQQAPALPQDLHELIGNAIAAIADGIHGAWIPMIHVGDGMDAIGG